jgi:stage II sporulation protein D
MGDSEVNNLISAVVSVLLASSVSSANLRVDGHAVTHAAVYQGQHQLTLGRGDNRFIEGDIVVSPHRGGVRVMVRIPLEEYVAAALESEAQAFQEPEALKAMAVAVRTYAASNGHRHPGADLCDGTHCQRLRFPISQRMREAARATANEMVLYANQPARVFYHQNCGGTTASAASVWGGHGLPYLVSRPDPYCSRQSGSWRADVSKASLQRVLSNPALNRAETSTEVPMRLVVLGHNASGRVSAVRAGTRNWSGTQFRELVSGMTGQKGIRSGRFQIVEASDRYTFVGSGAGHGVGLCQHGAVARAEAGHDYRKILQAYFPGTRIAPRPSL